MQKFDTINVIPFFDIMLVLLAIVLTTATFINTGELDIDLPSSSSNTAPDNSERVEIAMNKEGTLFINENVRTIDEAEAQLQILSKDTPILIMMDESVEFKQFVEVIDVLKRLALDEVSVLTRKNS